MLGRSTDHNTISEIIWFWLVFPDDFCFILERHAADRDQSGTSSTWIYILNSNLLTPTVRGRLLGFNSASALRLVSAYPSRIFHKESIWRVCQKYSRVKHLRRASSQLLE
jgi:hypothetical protein